MSVLSSFINTCSEKFNRFKEFLIKLKLSINLILILILIFIFFVNMGPGLLDNLKFSGKHIPIFPRPIMVSLHLI